MVVMTTISEAPAVGLSEAGRAATPADAKAASIELHTADPVPARAKAPLPAPNTPSAGVPSRSVRRLIIPLTAVGMTAALVLAVSARWDAWVGATAVQTTDNATVRAETTRLSARVSGNVRRVAFLVNEAIVPEPWASPTVLMSRNLALVMLTLMTYIVTSLSNTMLVPNFLTVVTGLRPEQIGGVLLLYTALPLVVTVPAAVWLLRRLDARIVALLGLTTFVIAAWMGTRLTHDWAPDDFIPMALVQSVGQGLTFTGLLIFVVSNLNPARATAFVAYIQVLRLDVIEVASTAMTTWLRMREQVHSNLIGLYVSAGDSDVAQALGRLTGRVAQHSADAEAAVSRATTILASLVRREANVLSIIDGFQVAFWAAIVGLLLISLMRAPPAGPLTPAGAK